LVGVAVLPLALPVPQEPEPQRGAAPAVSKRELGRRAARALKKAFADGEPEVIREALRTDGLVDDGDVARALGAGFAHADLQVRRDTILARRFNPNAKAGSELLEHRSDRRVLESEELTIELILAIGQHRDVRAVPWLIDAFGPEREPVPIATARILALGRMRHPKAVEALIVFARSGFARGLEEPIVTALRALTGEDHGS